MNTNRTIAACAAALFATFTLHLSTAFAQGTAFTYQGRLNDGINPATGSYDLSFALYDVANGGAQQGNTVTNSATGVSNGLFTVTLDFGNQFPGAARWLEIGVRTNGGGAFATLSPRQPLTSTPYAVQSLNASNAAAASSVAAANITGTLTTAQLPGSAVTNGASGVNLTGTFSGNGTGITNLNANVALRNAANSFTADSNTFAGSVGIGTISPVVPLQVQGAATSLGPGNPSRGAIYGIQTSGDIYSAGVAGVSQVPGAYGLVGESDIPLTNVAGPAASSTGVGGISSSTNGTGVYGHASASSGLTFGVVGETLSPQGYAGYFLGRGYFSGNVGIGTTAPGTALQVNGTVTATAFSGNLTGSVTGNGGGLTNLNATLLTSGSVADARLSANVALRSGGNTFSNTQTFFGPISVSDVNSGTGNSQFNLNAGYPDVTMTLRERAGDDYVLAVQDGGATNRLLVTTSAVTMTGDTFVNGTLNLNTAPYPGVTAFVRARPGDNLPLAVQGTNGVNFLLVSTNGQVSISGNCYALSFSGNGAGVTNLNASQITSGTLPDTGLSTNVALLNGNGQWFTGSNLFNNLAVNVSNRLDFGIGSSSKNNNPAYGGYISYFENPGCPTCLPQTELDIVGAGITGAGNNRVVRIRDTLFVDTALGTTLVAGGLNRSVGVNRFALTNAFEVEGNASKTTAGSWLANSDARIKQDIHPVEGAIEKLNQVNLVSFRYTDQYLKEHPSIGTRRYMNVVAQEFAKVFPEYVQSSGEKLPDGSSILQVDTYPLTIYSAAAVQELSRKLQQKETEITELKRSVAELSAVVKQLVSHQKGNSK